MAFWLDGLQEVAGVGGGGSTRIRKEDAVLTIVDSLLSKVPCPFDIAAIRAKVREYHPATVVCLQVSLLHWFADESPRRLCLSSISEEAAAPAWLTFMVFRYYYLWLEHSMLRPIRK